MAENIVKKIDEHRRILIPQELRDKIGIKKNSEIELEVEDNKIIISTLENNSEDGSSASDNA